MKLVERPHPFSVSLREVIVHRDHVHTTPAQGVEVDRQGRHEGLSFPGGHLRDMPFMQNGSAKKLYVVVDHIPRHRGAGGIPMVVPNRLVPLNFHGTHLTDQSAVNGAGGNMQGSLRPLACSFSDEGKGLGKNFVQDGLLCHNG